MGDVQEALKNLVERLHEAAKDNLESIILYGSAARGDFHDAHSDLNVLCILRSLRAAELARVSAVVKWWTTAQHQPAPLFFAAFSLPPRNFGSPRTFSPSSSWTCSRAIACCTVQMPSPASRCR